MGTIFLCCSGRGSCKDEIYVSSDDYARKQKQITHAFAYFQYTFYTKQ